MRSVRGWVALTSAGVAAIALGGLGALQGGWLADGVPATLPTHATSTPTTNVPPTIAPRVRDLAAPESVAAPRTVSGAPLGLSPAPASTYATERPVTGLPLADGPAPTGTDEIGDPGDLHIWAVVDGQTVQDASTSQLIRSVPALVASLSRSATLLPGTLISTGSPGGAGYSRDPQIFLRDRSTVTVGVDGVGELTTHCRVLG